MMDKKSFLEKRVVDGVGITIAVSNLNRKEHELRNDIVDNKKFEPQKFLNRVNIELKRAERYRIFISLLVLDLSFIESELADNQDAIKEEILDAVAKEIREIDLVSVLNDSKLALLFPETNRQGAEIASKRITEAIKKNLADKKQEAAEKLITMEMSSFPDAAGVRSISEFLKEYSEKNIN